jgi:GNAT superfamily N-acetyltransferase
MTRVVRVRGAADLARCLPALLQLRGHLSRVSCREQILRQQAAGYRLVFLEAGGRVRSVAGYRLLENLAWGKFLYVDDLVTRTDARDRGYGGRLLTWLIGEARRLGCAEFHLDSGVQRHAAHAFYFKHRLHINSYHFARRPA